MLNAMDREVGATLNQVVLAWMARMGTSVRQSAPPVIPLVAASTTAQVQENLAALELTLSPDQMARLNDAAA
jgi:aryl-alcohol dehydrogenase-like predicted oxidoreductase